MAGGTERRGFLSDAWKGVGNQLQRDFIFLFVVHISMIRGYAVIRAFSLMIGDRVNNLFE